MYFTSLFFMSAGLNQTLSGTMGILGTGNLDDKAETSFRPVRRDLPGSGDEVANKNGEFCLRHPKKSLIATSGIAEHVHVVHHKVVRGWSENLKIRKKINKHLALVENWVELMEGLVDLFPHSRSTLNLSFYQVSIAHITVPHTEAEIARTRVRVF